MPLIQFSKSIQNEIINVFYNVCDGDFTQEIHSNLQKLGITKLLELQEHLVPVVMEGKYDVFVESSHETGKKFGYVLPIVNYISEMKSKGRYTNNEKPFAIILMHSIEACKKVISEIIRLYPSTKIVKLIGSAKEVHFIDEINEGCDIIVGSIVKFVKLAQSQNLSLLKRDITKVNFVVIDELEKLTCDFWLNYLQSICFEVFGKKVVGQKKIFSTCGLIDFTPENFMRNYAQEDYVIMKFQNKFPSDKRNGLTIPLTKRTLFTPEIIVAQPQNNIIVNNYTNNQHFISNRSYNRCSANRCSAYLLKHSPLARNYVEFLRPQEIRDTFCSGQYNSFGRQRPTSNPTTIFSSQSHGVSASKEVKPDNLPSEIIEYEIDDPIEKDVFTKTGVLRRVELIEINIFDKFDNIVTVLKYIFKMNKTFKVIVFVKRPEGCKFAEWYSCIHGLQSRALTRSQPFMEKKNNIRFFELNESTVLFIEDKYEPPLINNLHAHVVITLNLPDTEEDFERRIKYLGDSNKKGGLFIIMGTPSNIIKDWIINRANKDDSGHLKVF